jgi:hypothetical protein
LVRLIFIRALAYADGERGRGLWYGPTEGKGGIKCLVLFQVPIPFFYSASILRKESKQKPKMHFHNGFFHRQRLSTAVWVSQVTKCD